MLDNSCRIKLPVLNKIWAWDEIPLTCSLRCLRRRQIPCHWHLISIRFHCRHEDRSRNCVRDSYLRAPSFVLSCLLDTGRCLSEWSSTFFFLEWWLFKFIFIVSNIAGKVSGYCQLWSAPNSDAQVQGPPVDQIIRKSYSLRGTPCINFGQVLIVFVLDTINSVCDCVYLYDSLILHFSMWWITLRNTIDCRTELPSSRYAIPQYSELGWVSASSLET